MDTATKKVTRKRKALDDGEIENDICRTNAKINKKNTAKVTKPRSAKSTSTIKKNSVTDNMAGCISSIENDDDDDDTVTLTEMWNEAEVLSQMVKVSQNVAQNFIALLTEGCTLPFIARYRKTAVDQMMPDR